MALVSTEHGARVPLDAAPRMIGRALTREGCTALGFALPVAAAIPIPIVIATAPPDEMYTSINLPPDCPSKRTFHDWCRRIPGATKPPGGRVWLCPASAWRERASPRARPAHTYDDELAAIVRGPAPR